ncbi:MAG: hypothetical protein ACOC0M_00240 [Halomonas sp.]
METWRIVDLPVVPWVGDTEELAAQAIEVMAGWQFWREDERNLIMLVDDET